MKTDPKTDLYTLDALAIRLGADRRTVQKAIEADRFCQPMDHDAHKHAPRYRLHDGCEALAAWRWRSEPRIPDPDPVQALATVAERMAAVAVQMDANGGTFSDAVAAIFPSAPDPICPLCGEVHTDITHPPKYLPNH